LHCYRLQIKLSVTHSFRQEGPPPAAGSTAVATVQLLCSFRSNSCLIF
jgi:hypothetical protein